MNHPATKACACGNPGSICHAVSAAYYLIRDPRRGYIELPPYHPPPLLSPYNEQQNHIRHAYLRHLGRSDRIVKDEQSTNPTGDVAAHAEHEQQQPKHIALHHFHPQVVLDFAQQRHLLTSKRTKVPLTVTKAEVDKYQLGLGDEDLVINVETGQPSVGDYYFCPNYPVQQIQEDLKECIRRERAKRDAAAVTTPTKTDGDGGRDGKRKSSRRHHHHSTKKRNDDTDRQSQSQAPLLQSDSPSANSPCQDDSLANHARSLHNVPKAVSSSPTTTPPTDEFPMIIDDQPTKEPPLAPNSTNLANIPQQQRGEEEPTLTPTTDELLHFTVIAAVPAPDGRLPPPPRENRQLLSRSTPVSSSESPPPRSSSRIPSAAVAVEEADPLSSSSNQHNTMSATPDVMIVTDPLMNVDTPSKSGGGGRVNVYINFDDHDQVEKQRKNEGNDEDEDAMQDPIDYAKKSNGHRDDSPVAAAAAAANDGVDYQNSKKKKKDETKRRHKHRHRRDDDFIIPTNIVLVCGNPPSAPSTTSNNEWEAAATAMVVPVVASEATQTVIPPQTRDHVEDYPMNFVDDHDHVDKNNNLTQPPRDIVVKHDHDDDENQMSYLSNPPQMDNPDCQNAVTTSLSNHVAAPDHHENSNRDDQAALLMTMITRNQSVMTNHATTRESVIRALLDDDDDDIYLDDVDPPSSSLHLPTNKSEERSLAALTSATDGYADESYDMLTVMPKDHDDNAMRDGGKSSIDYDWEAMKYAVGYFCDDDDVDMLMEERNKNENGDEEKLINSHHQGDEDDDEDIFNSRLHHIWNEADDSDEGDQEKHHAMDRSAVSNRDDSTLMSLNGTILKHRPRDLHDDEVNNDDSAPSKVSLESDSNFDQERMQSEVSQTLHKSSNVLPTFTARSGSNGSTAFAGDDDDNREGSKPNCMELQSSPQSVVGLEKFVPPIQSSTASDINMTPAQFDGIAGDTCESGPENARNEAGLVSDDSSHCYLGNHSASKEVDAAFLTSDVPSFTSLNVPPEDIVHIDENKGDIIDESETLGDDSFFDTESGKQISSEDMFSAVGDGSRRAVESNGQESNEADLEIASKAVLVAAMQKAVMDRAFTLLQVRSQNQDTRDDVLDTSEGVNDNVTIVPGTTTANLAGNLIVNEMHDTIPAMPRDQGSESSSSLARQSVLDVRSVPNGEVVSPLVAPTSFDNKLADEGSFVHEAPDITSPIDQDKGPIMPESQLFLAPSASKDIAVLPLEEAFPASINDIDETNMDHTGAIPVSYQSEDTQKADHELLDKVSPDPTSSLLVATNNSGEIAELLGLINGPNISCSELDVTAAEKEVTVYLDDDEEEFENDVDEQEQGHEEFKNEVVIGDQKNDLPQSHSLRVPREIEFSTNDDDSLHNVSVGFTESVVTSMTDRDATPPGTSSRRTNLNELYGELIAWESKRRTRYASELDKTSLHWRCRKELVRDGVLETAKAERLILGASEAVKIFAETMQASFDDVLIDDDGSILTDARKQNKVMLQRQSEFYTLGASANVQDENSTLLDSLIKSQSLTAENFNQSAFVQNDVIEDMNNLRKQLQQQMADIEKKGDQIILGMKLAEEQVQRFWDEVDGALSDAAFSALNKASLNVAVDNDEAGRRPLKRDGWLVEMQYRVAVSTQISVWECCKHDLSELYQSINHLEFQRRNKLQQVLLAFLPRHRRLFLGLPGILEPVLDGYLSYRTDHPGMEAMIEDSIQKQSQCYLRYEHERRSSIMNRSRSYKPDLTEQEMETIDSVFGSPLDDSSHNSNSIVRLAKVIERNTGAVWGGTWKLTLAVVTATRFLHFFDLPDSPELEVGTLPTDALATILPSVSDNLDGNNNNNNNNTNNAGAILNEFSDRQRAKNKSFADLFKGVTPVSTVNLTNSILKDSSKYPEQINIVETLPGNFTSNRRRHTFRVNSDRERAEWLSVLHDTKLCDDTATLSETVSDTEPSVGES